MRLRWTPEASVNLESIKDYLQQNRPELALPTMRKLYDGVRSLKDNPYRCRHRADGRYS